MSLFDVFRKGLSRTRDSIVGVFRGTGPVSPELYEELLEALLGADVGLATAEELVAGVKRELGRAGSAGESEVRACLERQIVDCMDGDSRLNLGAGPVDVLLFVGVNGTGKTTTIGKLAARLKREGRRVMLAAGDTFRAAAGEQLAIWAQRAGADIVAHKEGSDPAAVVFDAMSAAKARGHDVILVDTAGRIQTKSNLMEELKKINRVISRELPGQPCETLIVLDATTGQNAIQQAKEFKEAVGVTGAVITKMDGTAKGGVVIGIWRQLGIPVKLVGMGEKMEDLYEFDPSLFARALLDTGGSEI